MNWKRRSRGQNTTPVEVAVRRCPGHAGILGNEAADALAKAACGAPASNSELSVARAKIKVKAQYEASVILYWAENSPSRYKELGIGPNTKITIKLARLGRRTLRYLPAARSGHGDFADYHRRFQHENATLTCSCGEEKSHNHFFYCHLGQYQAQLHRAQNSNPSVPWDFASVERDNVFNNWVRVTNFFERAQ